MMVLSMSIALQISVSTMGGGGRTAVVRASADDTGNKSGTYSNQSMRKLFVYNLAPYTTSVTLRVVGLIWQVMVMRVIIFRKYLGSMVQWTNAL